MLHLYLLKQPFIALHKLANIAFLAKNWRNAIEIKEKGVRGVTGPALFAMQYQMMRFWD